MVFRGGNIGKDNQQHEETILWSNGGTQERRHHSGEASSTEARVMSSKNRGLRMVKGWSSGRYVQRYGFLPSNVRIFATIRTLGKFSV